MNVEPGSVIVDTGVGGRIVVKVAHVIDPLSAVVVSHVISDT
jgi:hypothetical protein